MKQALSTIFPSAILATVLCLLPQTRAKAQNCEIRPSCNPSGQCQPNTLTFGYNDTVWREWPLQPRPEVHNSRTVGATVIPPPPPTIAPELPHYQGVTPKSAVPSGDSILPVNPGATNPGGGTIIGPSGVTPGTPGTPALPGYPGIPIPGIPGIPGPGLDLGPKHPDATPKPDATTTPTPDQLQLPSGVTPTPLTPTPLTPTPVTPSPSTPNPKTPNPATDVPAPKSTIPPGDLLPTPPLKPDSPPAKAGSLSPARNSPVAANAGEDFPIQPDWNASLKPDVAGDSRLQSASYEQAAGEKGNPLRCSLDGYCPVQLLDHERWVAGNPAIHVTYAGHTYQFSSARAMKQFAESPEKYIPAQEGNDVVTASEESRTARGSVDHSAVWHGKLYLFCSSKTLAAFQDDPARYVHAKRPEPVDLPVAPGPAGF
jgi:YHS domain-containing protein